MAAEQQSHHPHLFMSLEKRDALAEPLELLDASHCGLQLWHA
jgi:hypothetical protein